MFNVRLYVRRVQPYRSLIPVPISVKLMTRSKKGALSCAKHEDIPGLEAF